MGRPSSALLSALGAALSAALLVLLAAPAASSATTPPQRAAANASKSGPALTLLAQTPWVGPGQAMQLRLSFGSAPRSGLTLGVSLYQHLTSRSAFTETTNGTAVGPVLASTTLAADTLAADPQGGVDLTIPVTSGDSPGAGAGGTTGASGGTGSGQLVADLHCPAGACGGVYPVRLQLTSSAGLHTTLFTYLVYADPPAGTQKLRAALVVPLAAQVPAPDRAGKQPGLSVRAVDPLAALAASLGAHPAPVTLVPQPATVAALSAAGRPRTRAVLGALGTLAAAPDRLTLSTSFVPVDATALVSAGLGAELREQVHRAGQVLAPLHPESGIWLAGGALDQASMAALSGLGFGRVVVPASDVVQNANSSLTTARPFSLGAGRGQTLAAVQSDAGLGAHLQAATGPGAALAAYQLLADLALIYFEQPNLTSPRGVVAMPPASWSPSASFMDTVLAALPGDPLVAPVTLAQLFDTVPTAPGPARRAVAPTGSSDIPARQVHSIRNRVTAFASAVVDPAGLPTVHTLDDLLLQAEASDLRSSEQRHDLDAAEAALQGQLSLLSVRTDTVRLTSTAAKVPVTLLKQSAYGVAGTVQIAGDKVVFPAAGQQDPGAVCRAPEVKSSAGRSRFQCTATIAHSTNAIYVAMRARATGDFRLSVTFISPSGGLVLTSSHLTVRSMSTSVVAIVLSLAAVAVLLLWWGRTLWRGRPGRRGAHVRGAGAREA